MNPRSPSPSVSKGCTETLSFLPPRWPGAGAPQSKLLDERVATLGRAREPEQRCARRRLAGEQLLQGCNACLVAATDHRCKSCVGVEALAVAARDHEAAVEGIGCRGDDLGQRAALAKADVAGNEGEQKEEPDRGERHDRRDKQKLAQPAHDERDRDEAPRKERRDHRQTAAGCLCRIDCLEGRRLQLYGIALTHGGGG